MKEDENKKLFFATYESCKIKPEITRQVNLKLLNMQGWKAIHAQKLKNNKLYMYKHLHLPEVPQLLRYNETVGPLFCDQNQIT